MKVNKKVIFEVYYNDLDRAITQFLKSKDGNFTFLDGSRYESVSENEWSNDSCYNFNVTGQLSDSNRKIIEEGIFDGLSTRLILDWMCEQGEIEPGEYIIRVSW